MDRIINRYVATYKGDLHEVTEVESGKLYIYRGANAKFTEVKKDELS